MMFLAAIAGLVVCAQGPEKPVCYPGQMMVEATGGVIPMPLKHTEVKAQISGFGAEVVVRQHFSNPSKTPIEAVYTFPLPHDAAVNQMNIRIGPRVIEGMIKPRNEARAIYEAAKNAGQTAALLDQERPNVFTQSIANVMPSQPIDVEIHYVQVLKYEEGSFEFVFPMVVGPRYTAAGTQDAAKIVPPAAAEGTRTGHTIDLSINLDAGAPIQEMHSVLHKVRIESVGRNRAHVELAHADRIPNRDFILRYRMASDSVASAMLTHYDPPNGGYFSLILMPPKAPKVSQIANREFIFVVDESGSQAGWPIEKSKDLTLKLLQTLRPGDTFNVIGFNTSTSSLWTSSRPLTSENLAEAETFLKSMAGGGGTDITGAVKVALGPTPDPKRLRLVIFNTDGFVGEEHQVLATIHAQRGNARLFTFGIGNSVNRYLIDAMSDEGLGASEIVTLRESADEALARFTRRIQTPVLTNVSVQIDGISVSEMLPKQIPDVFDQKPVVVYGRFENPGAGHVTLRGNLGNQAWSQTVDATFSPKEAAPAIEALWARSKIERLERDGLAVGGEANGTSLEKSILEVAMKYGIMSSQTSFVAVEQRVVNVGGKSVKVRVPVERVEGVGPLAYPGAGRGGLPIVHADPAFISLMLGNGNQSSTAGTSIGGFNGNSSGPVYAGPLGANSGVRVEPLPQWKNKLDAKLLKATGRVLIEVDLSEMNEKNLKKLQEIGLKIDDKLESLKAVFGACDAKILEALAKLEFVQRISKIPQ